MAALAAFNQDSALVCFRDVATALARPADCCVIMAARVDLARIARCDLLAATIARQSIVWLGATARRAIHGVKL